MNFLKVSKVYLLFFVLTTFVIICSTNIALAGSLTPSSVPAANGYTLSDIFNRLSTNTATTSGSHSFGATTTPRSTFPTLIEIYNAIPTIYPSDFLASSTYLGVTGSIPVKTGENVVVTSATSTNKVLLTPPVGYYNGTTATVSTTTLDFSSANILFGKYIFGLTGSIPVKTGENVVVTSATSTNKVLLTPPVGYYDGIATVSTTSVGFDPVNIKSGTDIFGIVGTMVAGTDTSSGTAVAGDLANGKIAFSASGQITGSMFTNQKWQTVDDATTTARQYHGEESTWVQVGGTGFLYATTSVNFMNVNGPKSGAIWQDTRTGIMWSDLMSIGLTASSTNNSFTLPSAVAQDGLRPTGGAAIGFCDALNNATPSGFGGYSDWYLPTQKQLMQAYIDGSNNSGLPNTGYTFWSSTEYYNNPANAWYAYLSLGYASSPTKTTSNFVRCVRP